jgi:hypothetical protein
MSDFITPAAPKRRSRKRLAIWLSFAVLGVSMGAVWATGFASVTGNAGSDSGSSIVATSGPSQPTSSLNSTASANGAGWTVGWAGLQGSTTKQWFFKVDLTGKSGTYNVAALMSNGAAVSASNWSTLQLNMENDDTGTDNTVDCATATFNGSNQSKVVTFDTQDAGAYWNGLAGGHVYCIGVAASPGMDSSGTFLRRADTSTIPVNPSFVATVNRAS